MLLLEVILGDFGKNNGQKQPPELFYKKALLKNFAIFTGENLCLSLFLTTLQAFRLPTFLKRDSNAGVFQ